MHHFALFCDNWDFYLIMLRDLYDNIINYRQDLYEFYD